MEEGIVTSPRGRTPSLPNSSTTRAGFSDTQLSQTKPPRPIIELNIFERWMATNPVPRGPHPPYEREDQVDMGLVDRDPHSQYTPVRDHNAPQPAPGSQNRPTPLGQSQVKPFFEDSVLLNEELQNTILHLQAQPTAGKSMRGLTAVSQPYQAQPTLPNPNETKPLALHGSLPKKHSPLMTCHNPGDDRVATSQHVDGTTLPALPLQDKLRGNRRGSSNLGPTNPAGSGHGSSTAYTMICNTQRPPKSVGNGQSVDTQRQSPPQMEQQIDLKSNGIQGGKKQHNETMYSAKIPTPSDGNLRFLHLNTGGISSKAKFLEFKLLLQNVRQFNAEIFSINEHTLDTSQAPIKRTLQDINQQCNKFGQIVLASSNETYPRAYKPGGTMMGLTGQIASRKVDEGTDRLGRWAWVQLIGKQEKAILIISAYRVSQTHPGAAGYTTAYMQQYRALLKANVSKPNPRQKLLDDLETFISNWRVQNINSSVILMMDANGDSTDIQLQTFIANTALHDTVEYHSPHLAEQSTYRNGRKRIDYILVTEDLLALSTRSGHTPYDTPFISDHRGVFWDIPSAALFEAQHSGPMPISQRGLQLDRPRTTEIYIHHLKKLYEHHTILTRAQAIETKLHTTTDPHMRLELYAQFNALDMEKVRYMKSAEKNVGNPNNSNMHGLLNLHKQGVQ